MSLPANLPPVLPEAVPPAAKTLRKLFLTLFLRGRGFRGMKRSDTPNSVGRKLAFSLLFYFAFGFLALGFMHKPVFALAVYLHGMTFVFLGMFVAASAGEILFNKEEADILLHRPVEPRTLLWAKIRVLVEVSLWLAGAFNLVGLYVGSVGAGNWLFLPAHVVSTVVEALFCTGCVVLSYQLCLRWFGRERLDGLMTMAQVVISVAVVLAGQILPRIVFRIDRVMDLADLAWWVNLLPPAWFAGMDDAVAGNGSLASWALAAIGLAGTALVLWLAFGRLADAYGAGLQLLNESAGSRTAGVGRRRWLARLVEVPPLSWWLRDRISRASFLLVAAYLARDRDVKLRVYPGLAPILVIPFIFLLQGSHGRGGGGGAMGFGIPFSGMYLGMVPLLGVQILQYSQQFQASEVFRAAPLLGPGALVNGARRAAICFLMLPIALGMALLVWVMTGQLTDLLLYLPGLIAMPVFSLLPTITGGGIPFSQPPDATQAARRGGSMILVMVVAMVLSFVASLAWSHHWFGVLVGSEMAVSAMVYFALRWRLNRQHWRSEN